MKAIVACDRNWGIGKNGDLLCHLPGDLKYFKEKTLGKCCIMGRKTLESLPGGRPLPDRETVVLSGSMEPRDGVKVLGSIDEILEYTKDKDTYVCGGGMIYREFIDYCDSILVTHIDEEFDADTYFPNLDELGFTVAGESEYQEDNGHRYCFREYVR